MLAVALLLQVDGLQRPAGEPARPIFLFFVDDLHLDFDNTGRLRQLMKRVANDLVHEGDLVAVVSSGPSSIRVEPTSDRASLDSAIARISGAALKPAEMMRAADAAAFQSEVKYRIDVALSKAYQSLDMLAAFPARRKVAIYLTNGYALGATELEAKLAQLTQAANRTSTTVYPISANELVPPPSRPTAAPVDPAAWEQYVRSARASLRALADLTGGHAVFDEDDYAKLVRALRVAALVFEDLAERLRADLS